jgi:hypothetical protein
MNKIKKVREKQLCLFGKPDRNNTKNIYHVYIFFTVFFSYCGTGSLFIVYSKQYFHPSIIFLETVLLPVMQQTMLDPWSDHFPS